MFDSSASETALMAFWSPGPAEMLLLAVVALLLYGGNLPEVARSWGKSFAEFRRGLTGIQNEWNDAIHSDLDRLEYRDDRYPYKDEGCDIDGDDQVDEDGSEVEDASISKSTKASND